MNVVSIKDLNGNEIVVHSIRYFCKLTPIENKTIYKVTYQQGYHRFKVTEVDEATYKFLCGVQ